MLLSNLEIQYGPDAKDLLGDPESMVESRYGIRCYLTNERIIFVDAEPDNGARISKESVSRQVRAVWTLVLTLHKI